jgi:hypothetical protein
MSIPGEVGSVFVSVVPSLAGMAEPMSRGAKQAATTFADTFNRHPALDSFLSRMDFAAFT